MKQVWIVEATETFGPEGDERDNRAFLWAFPDRETAHKVYAEGERTVRSMSWRLSMAPYGSWFNAQHDIGLLAKEES